MAYAADSNITSDGSGNWATTGNITLNNGKVFQGKETGGTVRNLLWVDGSNFVVIAQASAGRISFRNSTNTELVYIDGSGNYKTTGNVGGGGGIDLSASTLTTGLFKLLTGSVTRIQAAGPYSVTTTGTFFNHNLGVIPDFVIPVIDSVIGAAHAAAVDYATMTSTQVKLSSDLAGGLNVRILSFKF